MAVEENVRTDSNLETSFEQGLLFIPHPFAMAVTIALTLRLCLILESDRRF